MSEPWNGWTQERMLWQRWSRMREAASDAAPDALTPDALNPDALNPDALNPDASTPDALTLAAFADDRLTGSARATVEAFLVAHPEIAADVAAARQAAEMVPRIEAAALAAAIARAAALVPASTGAPGGDRGAVILPFRPARPTGSPWPMAARWGVLAASLALAGWLGFALGKDAYGDLAALDSQGGTRLADELLDPPSGFFGLADTSGT
jgi:anti-sigma factor RsiW